MQLYLKCTQNVHNGLSVNCGKKSFVIKAQIPQNASYRSFRINDFCYLTEQNRSEIKVPPFLWKKLLQLIRTFSEAQTSKQTASHGADFKHEKSALRWSHSSNADAVSTRTKKRKNCVCKYLHCFSSAALVFKRTK